MGTVHGQTAFDHAAFDHAAFDRAATRRRGLPNLQRGTFETIFGYAYAVLMTNVMLILANAPLLFFVAVVADPIEAWPFFLLLSVTVAPSVAAALGVFRALAGDAGDTDYGYTDDGGKPDGGRPDGGKPVQAFRLAYRRSFRRAVLVGGAAVLVLALCLGDLAAVAGTPFAAAAGPVFAVLATGAVAVAFASLVGVVLYPEVALRRIVATAFYVSVRSWYLTVLSVVCLGAIAAAVLVQPFLGAVLVPGILLFVAWSNTHFAFVSAVSQATDGSTQQAESK